MDDLQKGKYTFLLAERAVCNSPTLIGKRRRHKPTSQAVLIQAVIQHLLPFILVE